MTNEVVKADEPMDRKALVNVLRNSLYPGAAESSIELVIEYCRAAKLDPMMKPIHIVPMLAPTGRKDAKGYDIKEYRDVIMPGIGLYRTQAARTGELAGISEPEFGADKTEKLGDIEVTYPITCRVVVRRARSGGVAEFAAVERWKENYASKGRDNPAPNAMWAKRPYAQLAKCAQAQALRMAFPEMTGEQSTADEMAGKEYEGTVIGTPMLAEPEQVVSEPTHHPAPQTFEGTARVETLPPYDAAKFDANLPKWLELIWTGQKTADYLIKMLGTRATLTPEQIAKIRAPKPVEQPAADGGIEALRKSVVDDAAMRHVGLAEVEGFMGVALAEATEAQLHEALAYINDPDGAQA
jgi:phage recombination protein Bet